MCNVALQSASLPYGGKMSWIQWLGGVALIVVFLFYSHWGITLIQLSRQFLRACEERVEEEEQRGEGDG